MELDLAPGGGPLHTPPWFRRAPDRSVLVVVLLDAAGSWNEADGALAQALHDRLEASLDVTPRTSATDLVAALVAGAPSPRPTDEVWGSGSCSVLGVVVREALVEIVAAGALGAVHVPRDGRGTPLYRPRRLVDEMVRTGRLRADQVVDLAHRFISCARRFHGDEEQLTRVRRPLRAGDRVLLGAYGLARRESADLWREHGAVALQDALARRGESAAPTVIVTV